MTYSKLALMIVLVTVSQFSFAIDCYELGAQAELSVKINTTKKTGTLNVGESFNFKAKKQNVGGSIATYNFKANRRSYSLTVLNETVSDSDNRYNGILTNLKTLQKVFLGCSL